MESFGNMIPSKATVVRGGEIMEIMCKDIVDGDLVDMKFGDRIPADVRIIESHGFKVDNSPITGESEPLTRTTDCTNQNPLETRNLAFFSTNAVEGTARGIVVACGDHTVMGRIAGLTARLRPASSPIAIELTHFMKIISIWACCLGVIFGIASMSLGYSIIDSALFLIGIIVANVPEGLLATVIVSLSVAAKKMAAKNCVVKNLQAVETLGATSVICSDKTGTLTQNRMTVCHLWYNNHKIQAEVSHDLQSAASCTNEPGYKILMRCALLCNRAEFIGHVENLPIQNRSVRGDASEVAMLKYGEICQVFGDTHAYRKRNVKIVEIPFNSATKYQMSVHALTEGHCAVLMKGAPEVILAQCTHIMQKDGTEPMTIQLRNICDNACNAMATNGERVLGMCDLILKETYTRSYPFEVDPKPNFPIKGLRFVGFISLIDPPRPQVKDAVAKCRLAGIKVTMVTGDHPVTAASIARQVGIVTLKETIDPSVRPRPRVSDRAIQNKAIIVSGSTLREWSMEELDYVLYNYQEIVFARTSPTQKLQIVEGYQRLRYIVAVTGDGVNDSPALKKADIGIAMGISGSEVSQQSADMILLDDNFASIITGVEEGRKIFDNLKKSIVYTLASNVAEMMPLFGFILFNIPLPLGVIAILCIDLLTDMVPAISLAYENAETDIMLRPPRRAGIDRLVTFKLFFFAYAYVGIIESFAGFFVYFMIMAEYGFYPSRLIGIRGEWESYALIDDSYGKEWTRRERKVLEYTCYTGYMISVVVTQWADVIICKTRRNSVFQQGMKNWVLNISLIFETIVACILSYTPGTSYLKFYPLQLRWWCYAIPFSILLFVFDEVRKWHIRRYPNGWWQRETYY